MDEHLDCAGNRGFRRLPLVERLLDSGVTGLTATAVWAAALVAVAQPLRGGEQAKRVEGETRTLARKADAFYTPVHLNRGDALRFTLADGRTCEIVLLDCGVDVRKEGAPQWTLWAEVRIDGHSIRLVYSPFDMKALSRPKIVDGVRICLDGVKGLSKAAGWEQKKTGAHPAAEPPGDARLWVNDAAMPILPDAQPWFDIAQHRGKDADALVLQDLTLRQDADIHPASIRLTGNQKTGFLGGWTYGIHCGLDLQLKVGTRMHCVINGGEWRGHEHPNGPTQQKDLLYYVATRPDGAEWWFGNHHCSQVVAVQGKPMRAGEVYALSGRERAGIPHAHAAIRIRRDGVWQFDLNPWPAMWQGLQNLRGARGLPVARIRGLSPATVGQAIALAAETTIPGADEKHTWHFDDGDRQTGPKTSKTFSAAGMRQAILVVRTSTGADLDEQFVTVGQAGARRAPYIAREIVAHPPRPKAGQEVAFSVEPGEAPSKKPLTLAWDFGDGATGEGRQVKHVFEKPGRRYVIVRLADSESGLGRMDWYGLDIE